MLFLLMSLRTVVSLPTPAPVHHCRIPRRTLDRCPFSDARRYPEDGARCVPKVHSAVMHSAQDHASTSFPPLFLLLLLFLQSSFSLLTSRDRHIPTLATAARAVLSLYGYFYLFLRGEHTVRYYRPRNGVAQSESETAAGERGLERYGATENIYGHAVDKITANLHARWLAFAKLSFPLNRRVLLLPTELSTP